MDGNPLRLKQDRLNLSLLEVKVSQDQQLYPLGLGSNH